ncbi:MAG TPA: DipZ protein [Solirubrobacteraceae bacterium]|nr:DipZ protein [Solirubrobacteraceae bacterium]
MRPPVDTILAPPFPARLPWVNVASLRMDQQRGRPVLVEFWDFCRPNSIRTLPYVKAWHERYEPLGLRVVSVHSPGFPPSQDEDAVREAVARLGIGHPVLIDTGFELWAAYENPGWPARYLWDGEGVLSDFQIGEGGYAETELAIQQLLGVEREPLAPLRPEDDPAALLEPQTEDQQGAYSGPYAAGGVWAVLSGRGELGVNGEPVAVGHPGAYALLEHPHHVEAVLELEVGEGVECHATCFTPGVPAS